METEKTSKVSECEWSIPAVDSGDANTKPASGQLFNGDLSSSSNTFPLHMPTRSLVYNMIISHPQKSLVGMLHCNLLNTAECIWDVYVFI